MSGAPSRSGSDASLSSSSSAPDALVVLVHSRAHPLTPEMRTWAEDEREDGSRVVCVDAEDKRGWPALSALDVPLRDLPSAWKVPDVRDAEAWLTRPRRTRRAVRVA